MCKKYVFNNLKTIDDYKNTGYKKENVKRNDVKICFIDDKGFDVETFRSTGYINCEFKLDFASPNDVGAFDIIACDIDGIGVALDPRRQGLAVAETIIASYPEKIVLLYSSYNPYDYSEDYHSIGDGYFNKNNSINEIAKIFDKYSAVLFDEIAAWNKIEKQLRKNKICNKTIAFVEDLYVRSLEDKVNLFKNDKTKKVLDVLITTANFVNSVAFIVSRFVA